MKAFFKWFSLAFAGDDRVSIKRITGFIIILVILTVIYFTGFKLIPVDIWKELQPFLETLVWTVLLLFGINAGIDIMKLAKKPKDGEPPPSPTQP